MMESKVLNKPKKLKPGDTIGLVAPSGCLGEERLTASIKAMEGFGLKIKVGKSCRSKHGYFAGMDETRASDINEMFKDPEVSGVCAVRGGAGASRLLNLLDLEAVKNNPKFFMGYSDTTFLHILFNQRCNLETYHTPMPATEIYAGLDDYSLAYYKKILFDDGEFGELKNPRGHELAMIAPGKARGLITGGNLSIVATTLGTTLEIDTKDKILFLEDVSEEPYRIDRMLTHLRNAGKLDDCAGIILGGFTSCEPKDKENSLSLEQIFNEILAPLGKPTLSNLMLGHCIPTASLPLGATVELDATAKTIKILDTTLKIE